MAKDRALPPDTTSVSSSGTRTVPPSSRHSVDFAQPPAGSIDGRMADGADDVSGATREGSARSNKHDRRGSARASRRGSGAASAERDADAYATSMEYDAQRLQRAVADAGRWAYGIVLVEVWTLNQDRTFLYRPDGGFWLDPVFHSPRCRGRSDENDNDDNECEICRLVYPDHPRYVAPRNQAPGQGLPGALWSGSSSPAAPPAPAPGSIGIGSNSNSNSSWTRSFRQSLVGAKFLGGRGMSSSAPNSFLEPAPAFRTSASAPRSSISPGFVWRSIPQLDSDPDQPWNPRLKLLAELGLGLAAAVPFSLRVEQGIVVYAARGAADGARLRSEANETYLAVAADGVAAACALRGPRRRVAADRSRELAGAWRLVRDKVRELSKQRVDLKEHVHRRSRGERDDGVDADVGASSQPPPELDDGPRNRRPHRAALSAAGKAAGAARAALTTSARKAKGAGAPIPPACGWGQSAVTFVGSLATLLAVTSLSDRFQGLWGPEYGMVLGYVLPHVPFRAASSIVVLLPLVELIQTPVFVRLSSLLADPSERP
jgi:hypothetical protein